MSKSTKPAELAGASRRVRRPPPRVVGEEHGDDDGYSIFLSHVSKTAVLPPHHHASPLLKHKSWSPDADRDEAWLKRKGNQERRMRRSKSVTDEDLDELKACIELGFGFGFDSPTVDERLSITLPALGLYHAVNKHYYEVKQSPSSALFPSSASDCDSVSTVGSPHATIILGEGGNPQTVKTKLRQWAQIVACSVRQSFGG